MMCCVNFPLHFNCTWIVLRGVGVIFCFPSPLWSFFVLFTELIKVFGCNVTTYVKGQRVNIVLQGSDLEDVCV